MNKQSAEGLMRKIGIAAVTGTLVFAQLPVAAIAAEATSTTSSTQSSSQAPEPPSGDANGQGGAPGSTGGQPGEPPSGDAAGGQGGGMSGANTMTFDYTGTYSGAVEADGESVSESDASFEATEADQNAALAQNGGALALTGVNLTKSGDDTNGDNCNFYGLNSILLAVGEDSTATISDSSLSATSEGSNGIFATDGATVLAHNVQISTTAGNSRGLDATYGGNIIAGDVTISTKGDHSGGVATDRGGGNISVDGGTISTEGSGSPIVYSTGDIEISNVTGSASGSQLVGMEGLNTVLISNSTLESSQTDKTASDPIADGVIIYQSTSGDAESTTGETATFQAVDSTLKSAIQSGSMFYLTNTSANVVLKNTALEFDSDAANLLYAAGNDSNNWGTAGSNGADVTFTGINQTLTGNIVADTISCANVYLTSSTIWTGAVSIEQNAAGSTSDAPVNVNIDATSSWVVTGDSTVSNLTVADGGKVVDAQGRTVTIVAAGQTVVEGDSDYTVTVTGSYSTDYDASGAGAVTTDTIDRSTYDEAFGNEEASAATSAASTAATTTSSSDTTSDQGFFASILAWFKSLFS